MTTEVFPIQIYLDADACPVKEEAYRVARRHNVPVFVVANMGLLVPRDPLVTRVLVPSGPDVADDWIAERATKGSVVVTADVPLASRCVKTGATVMAPTGKVFSDESIGMALATRNLMTELRAAGHETGGPRPFQSADRSRFLSSLEAAIVRLRRAGGCCGPTHPIGLVPVSVAPSAKGDSDATQRGVPKVNPSIRQTRVPPLS